MTPLRVRWLGRVPYRDALALHVHQDMRRRGCEGVGRFDLRRRRSLVGPRELERPPGTEHDQLVIEPVETSVKLTAKGAVPEVGEPLKAAVGAGGGTSWASM